MQSPYVSVREAVEYFKVTKLTVLEWCHTRGNDFALQPVKNGKFIIHLPRLEAWLMNKSHEVQNSEYARTVSNLYKLTSTRSSSKGARRIQ